jgi:hypothetical protein
MRWRSRLASICENLERQEANLPAVPFSLDRGQYLEAKPKAALQEQRELLVT